MKYYAVTEVRKEIVKSKEYSEDELKKIMEDFHKGVSSYNYIDPTIELPNFTSIPISEETFKFIESVAIISSPIFGEKEYKINDLKFSIYNEEEHKLRFE